MVFLKIIQSHLPAAKQYLMFTVVYKYKVDITILHELLRCISKLDRTDTQQKTYKQINN